MFNLCRVIRETEDISYLPLCFGYSSDDSSFANFHRPAIPLILTITGLDNL
jgi:hypothetical protein